MVLKASNYVEFVMHLGDMLKQTQETTTRADSEAWGGGVDRDSLTPPPLKNLKNIGFLSNNGPDSLKNYKATKAALNVGHNRHTSETAFEWRFAGGPKMAHL